MSKIYVSNVVAYETPGDDATAGASVGLAVASRLNGNNVLVGSFNPNANTERKIGFVTFREKFNDQLNESREVVKTALEVAQEYAAKQRANGYKIGSTLDAKQWAWGEVDEDATLAMAGNDGGGASICIVEYIAHNEATVPVETEA